MTTFHPPPRTEDRRQASVDSPEKRNIRVLLVDDHPLVLRGIADYINREPDMEVCGEAENASQALGLIDQCTPDIISVDLILGGGVDSGLELIAKIRAQHPEILIVVFSMHEGAVYARRALRAGAAAYVKKRDAPGMLINAIRSIREK